MTATEYRISTVAEQTGFSTSALRYYESIGLIAPTRTDSGYRTFSQDDVEFLRFAARAKRMGLTLEEISELGDVWAERSCASVAARLRELVGQKVGETETRIAELSAFEAELRTLYSAIDVEGAGDDACGDDCACNPQPLAAPRTKTSLPLVAMPSSAPIACTLTDGQAQQRRDEWAKLLAKATRRQRTSDGVAVSFPPGGELARELSALVIAEQACCQFFDFSIRFAQDQTEMTVRAPVDAQPMVEALLASREVAS